VYEQRWEVSYLIVRPQWTFDKASFALALGGEEVREVVRIFRDHGPLLSVAQLEEHRAQAGIPRTTFSQYLSRLPMIRRYGPGLYALRGAEVTPGMLEAARVRVRAGERRICEWGWLPDGQVQVVCELSLGAAYSGALQVPPRWSRHVQGQFAFHTEHGHCGTLTVRGAFCWGFSRLFRREEVDAGDQLRVIFDLVSRRAALSLTRAVAVRPDAPNT
jgi:hypothetical protein